MGLSLLLYQTINIYQLFLGVFSPLFHSFIVHYYLILHISTFFFVQVCLFSVLFITIQVISVLYLPKTYQ